MSARRGVARRKHQPVVAAQMPTHGCARKKRKRCGVECVFDEGSDPGVDQRLPLIDRAQDATVEGRVNGLVA